MTHGTIPQITSEEAEDALIGSILYHSEKALSLCIKNNISKDSFTSLPRQLVWEYAVLLKFEDKPIDIVTITNHAKEQGTMDELISFLTSVSDPILAHLEYYITIVKQKQMKREGALKLYEASEKLSGEDTFGDIVTGLKFELDAIAGKVEKEVTKEDIYTHIIAASEKADEEGCVGIPSRWMAVQRKIAGYKRGKLAIVAARPSVGKTTYALNEARVMAEAGYKVGIISLETDIEEIYETLAADMAKVDLFKRAQEGWNENEKQRFDIALKAVLKLPIYVSDTSKNIQHICNWIDFMHKKYELDVFILDYIGIITPADNEARMTERVMLSRWSKQLFRTAKEHNIAGIVLAQINRGGEAPAHAKIEERWKYTPKLHNLKDSGSLEEDAYHVILLYNKPTETDMSGEPKIQFIVDVAKHKRGPKGKVEMVFNRDLQMISNVSEK